MRVISALIKQLLLSIPLHARSPWGIGAAFRAVNFYVINEIMAREDPHFKLRIPEDLRRKIYDAALENQRSMTAEIKSRLESTFIPASAFEEVTALREIIDRATALIRYFEDRDESKA
jgi:hypothetical protein